jgi:hypothetical protein
VIVRCSGARFAAGVPVASKCGKVSAVFSPASRNSPDGKERRHPNTPQIQRISTTQGGTALATSTRSEVCMMTEAAVTSFCEWAQLIQAEFSEMPGLHLSKRQAQRLWNLDAQTTTIVLDALEASHFLKRKANGTYSRANIDY